MAVLAIPVVASAATATTTISSVVSSVISISTNGTVNINVTPTGAGVQTVASDTATVSTNDSNGYTLQLNETSVGAAGSAATKLVSGGNNVPSSTGNLASPIAETAESWGYHVNGLSGFIGTTASAVSNVAIGSVTFAAVAPNGTPDTLKTTSTTATNDTTTIWYGIALDTAQPSGTYTNSVTYTATPL